MIEELVERWSSWLTDDGPIAGTVHRLEQDRARWRRVLELVEANPAIPHPLATVGWFWYHYASAAAIDIRRLADSDKRSASLGRVLVEVAEQSSLLTRDWYLDLWRRRVANDEMWEWFHLPNASDWFEELAGSGRDALPAEVVTEDQERLAAAVAPIKRFADKRLAHHNPDHDPQLSYAEVSGAIDTIGTLFRKYLRLIRQVDPAPLTDLTDWGAAFVVAWDPDGTLDR